ncbi:hypothetical protein [Yoonia algicola]|uniref:Uncharacterized protein n=1 Tax=Yoonia algicola TaxID=3137368 RepID=A0AAN0M0D2_9RHOB
MLKNPDSGQMDQDLSKQITGAADVTDATALIALLRLCVGGRIVGNRKAPCDIAAERVEDLTVPRAGEQVDGLALSTQVDGA